MEIVPAYYSCPRCNSRDHYFAKRIVGQMGVALDFENTPSSPGMLRGVEKDVALCRECGERMNYTPEQKILNEAEQKKEEVKAKKALRWVWGFVGICLLIIIFL